MAYGLPDNLWIWILVMAVIILALLWKDKISSGSSSSSSSSGGTTTPKEGPSVSMREASGSSHTVGEEFALRGRYDSGDGRISSKVLTMNGRDISSKISNWSSGTFKTGSIQVPDTDRVKCKIKIRTSHGTATDEHVFRPTGSTEPDGPSLDLRVETENSERGQDNGAVTITASPTPGDAAISGTEITLPGFSETQTESGSGDCVLRKGGLSPGTYQFGAKTEDENGKRAGDTGTFEIEEEGSPPPPPEDDDIPDWLKKMMASGQMPNVYNPQNKNELNLNVPEEAVDLLREIIKKTGEGGGGGETTQEVGMEGYHLLLALHMLQNDLDNNDNQQIVNQLQQINNSIQNNQISADELENSLRSVLHQVFDQDIENLLQGLDLSGDFDEDRIVQAIQNNDVDIGPLVNRLSNIENAIQQLQNQGGGDFSDIEAKLDQLVTAVKDSKMDEDMMKKFMSQLGDLQSKGVDIDIGDVGNNNGADVDNLMMMRLMDDIRERDNPGQEMDEILEVIREQGRLNRELLRELIEQEEEGNGMPDGSPEQGPDNNPTPYAVPGDPAYTGDYDGNPDELEQVEENLENQIQVEIEGLGTEYERLEKMIEGTNEVERLEQSLNRDIEEVVKHLKKARQYEHHLRKHQNGQLENGQMRDLLEEDTHHIRAEIQQADKALRQLKKDMRNMREDFSHLSDLETKFNEYIDTLADQKEALDNTEQMLESTENKLMDSGIDTL